MCVQPFCCTLRALPNRMFDFCRTAHSLHSLLVSLWNTVKHCEARVGLLPSNDCRQAHKDMGNRICRITLEHSPKRHFGTQPFWHHFGTQNATYHQTTANKTDIRFTDRRNSLEASFPFQSDAFTKKKAPMGNVIFRSVSPSATPATQN